MEENLVERISDKYDSVRFDQLLTYLGIYDDPGSHTLETLEAAFDEDDWGRCWEALDYEGRENFEQDEGYLRALTDVLAWIGEGSTT